MIIGEIDRQPYGNDSYTLRFRYEFNVGGSRYEGTQITAGDAVDTRRFGEFRNLYRAGNTVAVYYDPSNPGRSVLEPGLTTTHWVLAFGAPTLLGMAFIFGWAAVRVGH